MVIPYDVARANGAAPAAVDRGNGAATVEIENIHRNHAMGKPLVQAILDGATQIATPTLVGTLSICMVFFPVVLLTGVARLPAASTIWNWSAIATPCLP